MKASIDRSGCIGCGLCSEICPDVFFMADDGLADVLADGDIASTAEDSASEARDSCPVSVISID